MDAPLLDADRGPAEVLAIGEDHTATGGRRPALEHAMILSEGVGRQGSGFIIGDGLVRHLAATGVGVVFNGIGVGQDTAVETRGLVGLIIIMEQIGSDLRGLAALRATLDATNVRNDRYSRNEIKFVRTIDVNALQKKVDYLSRDLRVLDSKLQQANWTTDLK